MGIPAQSGGSLEQRCLLGFARDVLRAAVRGGLPARAVHLLVLRLLVQKALATVPIGGVLLTHAERGAAYSQPRVNQATTVVPDMLLVIASRERRGWRLTLASPAEAFRLMGMQLDTARVASFTSKQLIRIAGEAFHLQSACAFTLASLAFRPRAPPQAPMP